MYKVYYEIGNGYHCGCCRNTSKYDQEFDTLEEVAEFVARNSFELNSGKVSKADFSVDEIVEQPKEVYVPKEMQDAAINAHKAKLQAELDKRERDTIEYEKRVELAKLAELKKKYPDS